MLIVVMTQRRIGRRKGETAVSRPTETERVFDELLLTLARTGDRRASRRLAARWQPRLMRTARRILRDDELAREAVQESWTAICGGWLRLRDPAKFPAWAFGILHRKCADQLRAAVKARERETDLDAATNAATKPRAETLTAIDQAFDDLSAEHRAAATLFFVEGLSVAEIAAAVGAPAGTVKSRVFYARQQLRAALT